MDSKDREIARLTKLLQESQLREKQTKKVEDNLPG